VAINAFKDAKYEVYSADGVDEISMKSGAGCPAFDLN